MSKSKAVSKMLITIFFGYFGIHKFMEHKTGMGILYFCTLGLFGIGWLYDSIISISNCAKVFHQYAITNRSMSTKDEYVIANNTSHDILNSPALLERDFDNMEGHEFEHFCADLLSKNGYKNVEVTRGSGDQGIDIIAYKDGIKYGIQCKCYTADIGNKAVQEAFSGKAYYNCHVAAVLTNRYFTKSARELANSNNVLLWNRDILEKLIQDAE